MKSASGQPSGYVPGYLRLCESGELERRARAALEGLAHCRTCPWNCGVNRLADEAGFCRVGRRARVASYGPHHGEEDCLRGRAGSGTIFFAHCNLRCVFCQNFDISQPPTGVQPGPEVAPDRLAAMMIELQEMGCHNINWVTPEHVVPQILEAMPSAIRGGLRLPIVYNTSSFDALESLRLMEGVVDIYMPDFKYWTPGASARYLKCAKYPEAARFALKEMHRQVGDLRFDEHGLAVRGLLVRHLVMPGALEETKAILRFLASEVSADTYVNLMDQYHPAGRVLEEPERYPGLARTVTAREMADAYRAARDAGLHRFDRRLQVR